MSKVIKKVVKRVKKTFKSIKKFVKKHWKKIVIAAAIVFTAGAFAVVASGGTWGAAFSSVGATFSAGASSLTGGLIGTSAGGAGGSVAAGAFGAEATLAGEVLATDAAAAAAGGVAAGSTAGTAASVASTGLSVGKAMMLNTGLQAYSGYQAGKVEDEAQKERQKRYDSQSFYGMTRDGQTAQNSAGTGSINPTTPYDKRKENIAATAPIEESSQPVQPIQPAQPTNQQPGIAQPNINAAVQNGVQAPIAQRPQAPISSGQPIAVGQPIAMPDQQIPVNMDQMANYRYGRT